MAGKKIEFDVVALEDDNTAVLGSLVFDRRLELGTLAHYDLTTVADYTLLARDCIAALNEHSKPVRIGSERSFGSYKTAIKNLLAYCREKSLSQSIRMKDIDFEFMISVRNHFRILLGDKKTETMRRQYGNLLRLMVAGQGIRIAHADFRPPRNFTAVYDGTRVLPYSAEEALEIEATCRDCIRAMDNRFEKARALIALGQNPRKVNPRDPLNNNRIIQWSIEERPWNRLENILWYLENVLDKKILSRKELANGHSSLNNAFMGVKGSPYRKTEIYSYFYPLAEDLIPFFNLLAKKTGRNESSILGLRRDCLFELKGRFYMWYRKGRGGEKLYKKAIDSDGPFSPVELIRKLLTVTQPLVKFANQGDKDLLFLGLTIKNRGNPVKELDAAYFKSQMNREGGWCERNKLTTEDDATLRVSVRRWRVFYLCNRYRKHGQLARVSRDAAHSLRDTTVSYVANATTKHLHEKAIRDGQRSARALAEPVVLPTNDPKVAAQVLGTDAEAAKRVLKGEQDVLFASCRDFYNKPGGLPGTACDSPWACFDCRNAIVTRHVLPRVIKFKQFMEEQRRELSAEDWRDKFAIPWQVITQNILPKFTKAVIAEAERTSKTKALYIPIFLKT